MNWRVKGIVQKILALAPGGGRVNDWLQTALGDLRDFEGNVDRKLTGDWAGILAYLGEVGAEVEGRTILEIGTGWYPTLPVAFHLAGAGAIHTFDVVRHLDERKSFRMLRRLGRHLDLIAERGHVPRTAVEERYRRLLATRNLSQLLDAASIRYHAPADAASTGLPAASIDMVFSNSVLEHVPPAAIRLLLAENRRILRPGGWAVHCVACNDHYAHFDRSISFINFLRFNERQWWWWNNRLNYQNRLRAPDFLRLAEEQELRVVFEARAVRPGTREALKTLPLAPEFRHYSPEDLVATTVDFVAVPRDS